MMCRMPPQMSDPEYRPRRPAGPLVAFGVPFASLSSLASLNMDPECQGFYRQNELSSYQLRVKDAHCQ